MKTTERLAVSLTCLVALSCGGTKGKLGGPGGQNGGAKNVNGNSNGAKSIEFTSVTPNDLFTKETQGGNCAEITLTAKDANGSPVAGVEIALSTDKKSGDGADTGSVTPDLATTNSVGVATARYCSGSEEHVMVVKAKASELNANSGEITIRKKPEYELKFVRVDAAVRPAAASDDTHRNSRDEKAVIFLDLFDSGPNDCTNLYFKLTKAGEAQAGVSLTFRSQLDYPKGAKLASKRGSGTSTADLATGKKYLTYVAVSGTEGEFRVPVCSGMMLGTMLVSTEFIDPEQKKYPAQSPIISINSGIVNWANLSLTYDPKNAKTLRGYFNTNSQVRHPFKVTLGSRQDGVPAVDYPVSVSSETGRIILDAEGAVNVLDGSSKFEMTPLHMVDYRPYPVLQFAGDLPEAQNHCDPLELAEHTADVVYSNLNRNWRSTIVYQVRGQEFFRDANGNGAYDEGGDGFWDKNQNGFFDNGIDELTYDPGGDGFTYTSEWFIDLPTPFVDVDEDGIFTPVKDILLSDEYLAPNKKRDVDTVVWKHDYIPIYMGTSPYALTHAVVHRGDITVYDTTLVDNYYTNLNTLGLRVANSGFTMSYGTYVDISDLEFFGTASPTAVARTSTSRVWRHLFAHGVCGNPMPGDVTVEVNFEQTYAPEYGPRAFTAHFYIQPGDEIREPSRRLLADATGTNKAKINFNIVDHPSEQAGFPVEYRIRVGPCSNACTGLVAVAGVACDAHHAIAHVTGDLDTIPMNVQVNSVQTCTCYPAATGVYFEKGTCRCPDGTSYDTATAVCKADV